MSLCWFPPFCEGTGLSGVWVCVHFCLDERCVGMYLCWSPMRV